MCRERVPRWLAYGGAVVLAMVCAGAAMGQTTDGKSGAPAVPRISLMALAQQSMALPSAMGETAEASDTSGQNPSLTLTEAEQMAIKNNPHVTVARLLTLAQHQMVREARSAELPTLVGSITAMDAADASRISAGSLTASRLFEHAGAGGGLTQLITDFGRTSNLVAFSKLQEKAQKASAMATTNDIAIAADQAYFNALQAQALLRVADENVQTRQTTDTQVSQLTKYNLKSTLDLSFADVNLSQAKLLQLDARNNVASTMAALDSVLGLDHQVNFRLLDDEQTLQAPPVDVDRLLRLALQQRPDLVALDYAQQAAVKFSHAQRDQLFPTISAMGSAGSVPVRPDTYFTSNWWGGVGVNVNIPIFNGFLYTAQAKEASIRAKAAAEHQRALKDRIVRDVRTAWLTANTAYQRVTVTQELLKEADLALNLAQDRYRLGLSSIVELTQAQYQQTDAAIGNANARYQYRLALATINYEIGVTP